VGATSDGQPGETCREIACGSMRQFTLKALGPTDAPTNQHSLSLSPPLCLSAEPAPAPVALIAADQQSTIFSYQSSDKLDGTRCIDLMLRLTCDPAAAGTVTVRDGRSNLTTATAVFVQRSAEAKGLRSSFEAATAASSSRFRSAPRSGLS